MNQIYGAVPFGDIRFFGFWNCGPNIHPPGKVAKIGRVFHILTQTCIGLIGGYAVNQLQNAWRRAEGIFQHVFMEFRLHRGKAMIKLIAHAIKPFGIGPLERIDGLLFIPHNENCAGQTIARGLARRKFFSQFCNDLPLRGRGILRLIHKHMVDAAIKAEQHPLGQTGFGQKSIGQADQVVKIKPTTPFLGAIISGEKLCRELMQRV